MMMMKYKNYKIENNFSLVGYNVRHQFMTSQIFMRTPKLSLVALR